MTQTAPAPTFGDTVSSRSVIDRARQTTVFEWGSQEVNPLAIQRGEGIYLYSVDGTRYVDFNSVAMCVNIGHGDPRVGQAIQEQMAQVAFVSPFMVTPVRAEVGEMLASVTPPGLDKAFFTLAGADANEAAVRTARLVSGRRKIMTRHRSYHGGTMGMLAASGDPRRGPVESFVSDIVRIPDPYHYRCPSIPDEEEFRQSNLAQIEEIMLAEDPDTIAAVLVEPITGSNGIIIPPAGWLNGLSDLCKRYGVLLILDEVMSGFGRTGRWFASEHEDVVPDIMTVAKGITSGYVPLGACILSTGIAEAIASIPFGSGLTYQSHPVSLAAAKAVIGIYQSDDLIERSAAMGAVLEAGLRDLQDRHPSVGDVRSIGLFSTLELVADRDTREPLIPLAGPKSPVADAMQAALLARGVLANLRGSFLFANPPLVVNEDQIHEALEAYDDALAIADGATTFAQR